MDKYAFIYWVDRAEDQPQEIVGRPINHPLDLSGQMKTQFKGQEFPPIYPEK